jgi:hypothetical protein
MTKANKDFKNLGVTKINVSDSDNSKIVDIDAIGLSAQRIDLDMAEREILLKACKMYRAKIPIYLRSKQAEIQMLDHIIQKLT